MREIRNSYKMLVLKFEENIPLGSPGHSRDDNIKVDLRKDGSRMWAGLIWLRVWTGGGLLCVC
jgi:hypothetical protein